MERQSFLHMLLREELDQIRGRNPSYSMRSFGKKLGMAPSMLSQILTGKRNASLALLDQIADRLELDLDARTRLREEFSEWKMEKRKRSGPNWNPVIIPPEEYRQISAWQHYAILSLVETKDFQSDPKWIARRLGIRVSLAKASVDRLVKHGLLRRESSGELRGTGLEYKTTDEVASLAIRQAYCQDFELAKVSLKRDPLEIRDFRSMTLAIDPRKLPEAKARLRAFRNRFSKWMEKGDQLEVYTLCLAFFPVSIPRGKS